MSDISAVEARLEEVATAWDLLAEKFERSVNVEAGNAAQMMAAADSMGRLAASMHAAIDAGRSIDDLAKALEALPR